MRTRIKIDAGNGCMLLLEIGPLGGRVVHSLLDGQVGIDSEDDLDYITSITAIERLVLGHACAGVNVRSADYLKGLRTALEALANE